jgi:hypothetical protein
MPNYIQAERLLTAARAEAQLLKIGLVTRDVISVCQITDSRMKGDLWIN